MLSKINTESFKTVECNEFLPSISPLTTIGGGTLIIIFGAAVTLAATLKYNVTVKAPASISPVGGLQIVQAATEGTIKTIGVKENQIVKKGDRIAWIDDSQLQTKKFLLQGNIQQSSLQLIKNTAQIKSLDNQIDAENKLMNRAVASAQAELNLQQRNYENKQKIALADMQAAQASVNLAQQEMKGYEQLANAGGVAKLQVIEKEQDWKVAQAKLLQAQAALNPTSAEVTMATEQIAQEQARGLANLAALRKERETLQSTQIELLNQLNQSTKEFDQIQVELKKTFILAPTDGTILKLELRNPGQVVGLGSAIAQIVPANTPLTVKAYVNQTDINQVKPGQEVQMRVSACPYPDYGTLKGTVTTVAPDAMPATTDKSVAAYEVTIQPQNQFVGVETHTCRLQAGMEARADITSRQETVLQFILKKARLIVNL